MAVTFTSNGYDSTSSNPYTETAWADAHPAIGSASYGVRSPLDWKVTAVSGQDRTVSIASGRGWGHGVTDKTVANETIQLSTISSGSRWDLIVVRRDWTPTAGTSKFDKVNGGATMTIPGGRLVGPGNIDDQPIAMVQVTSGQTQPTAIIDLRVWSGDGGGIVASHDLARSYLDAAGTRLHINGVDWIRRVGANDVPEWVKSSEVGSVQLFGVHGELQGGRPAEGTGFLIQTGTFVNATDNTGYARCAFPKPFPNGLMSVILSDGDDGSHGFPAIFALAGKTDIFGQGGLGSRTEFVYVMQAADFLENGPAPVRNKTHRINYIAIGW